MKVMGRIEPQPPPGIKYMLGGESWLPPEARAPRRLHCEQWGNLGPLELDPVIRPNAAGFRVRTQSIPAPEGVDGFVEIEGVYYWTDARQGTEHG